MLQMAAQAYLVCRGTSQGRPLSLPEKRTPGPMLKIRTKVKFLDCQAANLDQRSAPSSLPALLGKLVLVR